MRRVGWGFVALLLLSGCALTTREHYPVFFQPASAALDAPAQRIVASVADKAKARATVPVTVIGFAVARGSVPATLMLSEQRARAVADALVADGVDAARIHRQPEGGVNYEIDSVESRRVEIVLGAP
jgi:peptidoglycan-binding protein ArfA